MKVFINVELDLQHFICIVYFEFKRLFEYQRLQLLVN